MPDGIVGITPLGLLCRKKISIVWSSGQGSLKKKGESVTEYGFALNRIASDAYPRMPPEARETIVIDQFVSGLPSKDLRRHVQFHHPS